MAKNNIFPLIIVFVAIVLMAFALITMVSKIDRPDINETPELAEEAEEQGRVAQPFYLGMNALAFGILICIFIAGLIFILTTIRKSMGGGF